MRVVGGQHEEVAVRNGGVPAVREGREEGVQQIVQQVGGAQVSAGAGNHSDDENAGTDFMHRAMSTLKLYMHNRGARTEGVAGMQRGLGAAVA